MYSFSAAARALGLDRAAVPVAVKLLGIEPKPIPYNGNAKGLSDADLRLIAESLGRPVPTRQQRKAALAG